MVATVRLVASYAYLDHVGPLAIAHRGGAGQYPENTIEAFAHAVELGFRYLETDVHVTRDGHVIAFHDEVLDRVTDCVGRVDALDWKEVRQARIAGVGEVLSFSDLLDAFPDHRLNIDPKSDAVVGPLIDLLTRHDAVGRVCIGSFSDARIARMRASLGNQLCTSGGPRAIARLRLASMGMPVRVPHMACVQVPVRTRGVTVVDHRFLRAAHERELPVHVWTIDQASEMHRLLDLGVDGIMTDRPEVLREVLRSRGSWHGHPAE